MNPAVILTYHRVRTGADPLLQAVSPSHFEAHVAVLAAAGVDVVPLAALDRPSPRPRVAITFDDGYADNATAAAPVLRAAAMPATFFVPSRVCDDPGEFWWDTVEHLCATEQPAVEHLDAVIGGTAVRVDVRTPAGRDRALRVLNRRLRAQASPEIATTLAGVAEQLGVPLPDPCAEHAVMDGDAVTALAADFEIGSHAVTHTMLTALDPAGQEDEVRRSRERLAAVAGTPVTSLAYPYGTPESFSPATQRAVAAAGYERACANTPGPLRRDRLAWPRHMVYDWPGEEFAARLAEWFANAGHSLPS
jgi:peptidoglycan/xylan/chitin deacetylase (PgdA/CDA1 family)